MGIQKKLFVVGSDVLGDGRVNFEWNSKANFIAAAGSKRKVIIFDRNGKLFDEINFPAAEVQNTADFRSCSVTDMKWDPMGEQLAVLPVGNTFVFLWSALTKEISKIDTEFKTQDFTCLAWSRNGTYLAVGTSKGNLLIYNSRERKKTPYVGKHTKRINAAIWNKDNLLATAGQDKMITLTDGASGETLKSFALKAEPVDICVSDRKDDGYSKAEENTFSMNLGRKMMHIMTVGPTEERPLELAFLEQYGPLQKHLWFGDGYILVGFKTGYVVVVSSHSKEISEEVHSGKYLDVLSDIAFCPSLNRIALSGATTVKVINASGSDFTELKGDTIELDANQAVERIGWTRDGQLLTVGTTNGFLVSYLASLPQLFDCHGSSVMWLTSLLEMTVTDVKSRNPPNKVELESEPGFCGLGPNHFAVGMNNQVWLYRYGKESKMVLRRGYIGSVTSIKLNETHAAALMEGKVVVHPLEVESGKSAEESDVVIPSQGQQSTVVCLAMTPNFVITGSRQGMLSYYLLPEVSPVNEYRHDEGGITRLWPQPPGTRLIFEDDRGGLNMFNPVNDHVMPVPQFNSRAETVLWDTVDPTVVVIHDGSTLFIYLYLCVSLEGPALRLLARQSLSASHTPLSLANGVLACRLRNGAIDTITLDTHRALGTEGTTKASATKKFSQNLALCRLSAAWECALAMRNNDAWMQLAQTALSVLDIPTAMSSYRMLGDASIVLSLERIRSYEDKNLLAGHVLVLLEKDYNQAQELFLRSSLPKAALEMRCDLKQWAEALKLADQLDPDNTASICKEYATTLEMTGEYAQAKSHYQQALDGIMVLANPPADIKYACQAGIARTTLQQGDIRQGRQLVLQLNNTTLFKECGGILENLNQLTEAAEMYVKAGQLERAASIYIQTKNFTAAAPLMAKISSSKLQLQYAKAKEAEGSYNDAATAFEAAGDMDNVVRLCLEKLNQPQRAYAIVRRTRSIDAASMLAKFCMQSQDFKGAVEFLLMANQLDQAFDIAQVNNEMDQFAMLVAQSAKPYDFQRIAQYYEGRGEFAKAGDMWGLCEQWPRAVQLYLKIGKQPGVLDKAIQAVEHTRNHTLGVTVLDYVNEECDGSAKDEYRFKLNIAMGQYQDAAYDAMELARFEQEDGNYRLAHDKLFSTYQQLESLNVKPPSDLVRTLMLLHSYTLVKSLIAINDHLTAARMLVRVARTISKFPKHIVPILTSTVIECHRAGLKKTAFEYASMLMRPEYRNQVAPKYKKKIELMVRKPDKDAEEVEEVLIACPFCKMPGPETDLQCVNCQNIIPFDIGTGKRMSLDDWALCPSCHFPCSSTTFCQILAAERKCPMCNEDIDPSQVRKVLDPLAALRARAGEQRSSMGGAALAATASFKHEDSPKAGTTVPLPF